MPLSEPDAYLRPVGPPAPVKPEPYPYAHETKAERIARLARPRPPEPQLISFGEQKDLARELAAQTEAMVEPPKRTVY